MFQANGDTRSPYVICSSDGGDDDDDGLPKGRASSGFLDISFWP